MTIDIGTGEKHVISTISPYTQAGAFAISPDGVGIALDVGANWLFETDLQTGATTSLGYFPGYSFSAFDYGPDGTLYGLYGSSVYSIDLTNLSVTHVQSLPESCYSLTIVSEPIPEPSSLAIWSLLSVAAGFGAWRRRRKR